LNNLLHQTIVVDVWSDGCPPRKIGRRGFSFGFVGEWEWRWAKKDWLGNESFTLPGYLMVGEIYEASVVGSVVAHKKTTSSYDKEWLRRMANRVGSRDVYSVGRHNCRAFSQIEFEKVP
jgi:hypothetical protein